MNVLSATRSATCKTAENDCLERRNSISARVSSRVAYKAERGGNELFWSPWKMYPRSGQDHLAGNGADFLVVLNLRTFVEPMHEAKQMTTGQPVGAASHTAGGIPSAVRIGSKSVSSRSDSFCIQAASSLFMGCFCKDLWKPCAHVCTVGPPGTENHDTDHHRDLDDPGIADLARV